ncbi:MAG: DUF1501 domain-containing protein [Ilumatobacter sp.]|nr:DUF1501 domain-containing protein [Ilumatobacter sp.]
MLEHDISTAGAIANLSTSELAFTDAHRLDRRRFLQLVGMGIGAGMVAGPGTSLLDSVLAGGGNTSWAAGPIGPEDGILVIIGMHGGNDGLNTVVPITDGTYYDHHGALAIPAAETLPIDATTGLNPALTALKDFWDRDQLAIVEGIGYPNPDLSHFNSMAKWMSGKPTGIPTSGWVGRWLDGHLGGSSDLFAAAEIGTTLPLHMLGRSARATAVPASRPSFGAGTRESDLREYETIRSMNDDALGFWPREVSQAFVDQLDVAKTIGPHIPDELPETDIAASLDVAARLINANLGFRVLSAAWGDFDSHAGQPDMHPLRMAELNEALLRFFDVLNAQWASRVTVMTYSEFGRTSHGNDGAGTDHGTSAPHFVFGEQVRGGRYGQRPAIAGLRRWDRMGHHVDFRDYYGSIIDGWLGGDSTEVLGRTTEDLGLFAAPPSSPAPTLPPDRAGDFVPIEPKRLVDTRFGTGAPKQKLGPGGTLVVKTAGIAGLPTKGVTAVVVNVTAAETEADTYLTIYERGVTRPLAANLNPTAERVMGNLVVTAVDDGGEFVVYNNAGSTHCIVDIAGYYSTSAASRLSPLVPHRLLDTRDGTGTAAGRVRGGQTIDVVVAGRGGVPATGVKAVVLNITSVAPAGPGYVTVHARGAKRPGVASLNYVPGHDIPNLVMSRVSADGKISLYVSDSSVDLVADVVACYSDDVGTRHMPVTPARILDTREGNGAPRARLGRDSEVILRVAGRGGVPANASAVVLNVTAVAASAPGYITVYPDGVPRPLAANLNVGVGDTVPNLVVAKIGADGNIRLYNREGTVDLVADVNGYFI